MNENPRRNEWRVRLGVLSVVVWSAVAILAVVQGLAAVAAVAALFVGWDLRDVLQRLPESRAK